VPRSVSAAEPWTGCSRKPRDPASTCIFCQGVPASAANAVAATETPGSLACPDCAFAHTPQQAWYCRPPQARQPQGATRLHQRGRKAVVNSRGQRVGCQLRHAGPLARGLEGPPRFHGAGAAGRGHVRAHADARDRGEHARAHQRHLRRSAPVPCRGCCRVLG